MTNATRRRASAPRKKQANQRQHDDVVPLIPAWVREWGWTALAPVGLALALISYAVGMGYGSASGWALFTAAVAVTVALGWRGYQRRLRVNRERREQALYEMSEFPRIDAMEWKDFEYYCADLMNVIGYTEIAVIGSGRDDKGLDILATAPDGTRTGIQVKHRKPNSETGRMLKIEPGYVHALHGTVMGGQHAVKAGILMTNSYVQPGGVEFATQNGLAIRDRNGGLADWMHQARKKIELSSRSPGAASATFLGRLKAETRITLAVVCGAALAVLAVVVHALAVGPRHAPTAAPAPSVTVSASRSAVPAAHVSRLALPPSPVQVVREFYAAISSHDWPKVWRLGGKDLGRGPYATYDGMVSGYRGTIRDVLTEVHATGDTVTGRFLAYQSGGVIRPYQFTYVVRDGVIVSGQQG
jgi:hypothetical protein